MSLLEKSDQNKAAYWQFDSATHYKVKVNKGDFYSLRLNKSPPGGQNTATDFYSKILQKNKSLDNTHFIQNLARTNEKTRRGMLDQYPQE